MADRAACGGRRPKGGIRRLFHMKKISILIPCYNEEENVAPISAEVVKTLEVELPEYDYELIFIDNDSTDQTRPILRRLCADNPRIKAIFNAKNFGQFNSPYYGMLQADGDCVISMVADFQDPVELIPKYVREWENGYKIVIGIKTGSKENPVMYGLRSCYYKLIKKLSDVEQISSRYSGVWTIRLLFCAGSWRNWAISARRSLTSSRSAAQGRRTIIFTASMTRRC